MKDVSTLREQLKCLCTSRSLIRVIVDTIVDDSHVRSVDGTIQQVCDDFILVSRASTADERSKLGGSTVSVSIPTARIAQVIWYEKPESR